MAENKKHDGEEMSVDELVSRLRDNISSSELPEDDSDSENNKTIAKKTDPNKDIASMLKKFMPEEGEEGDFELDDAMAEVDADFELEGDGEFDIEYAADEPSAEVYDDAVYETGEVYSDDDGYAYVDEEGGEVYTDENGEFYTDESGMVYADEDFEYVEGADEVYAESDNSREEFIPAEDDAIMDALSFEPEDEKPAKKSLFGGLFGLGRKKGSSLADGYAKMLRMELDAENGEPAPENEAVYAEEAEQLSFADTYGDSDEYSEDYAEDAEQGGEYAASDIDGFEMPELDAIAYDSEEYAELPEEQAEAYADEYAEGYSDEYAEGYTEDYNGEYAEVPVDEFDEYAEIPEGEYVQYADVPAEEYGEYAEDAVYEGLSPEGEPVPSRMFVLDNQQENLPEEEYFVSEKNPLAFDDDDETPIVPDESAFEDVGPSDISEFAEDEAAEYAEGVPEAYVAEDGTVMTAAELGDKDIDLMIALGYEDELEKVIGKEKVDEISDNLNAEIVDFIDIDSAYAFDGFEINSPDRFRVIGNRYKQEHSMMKLRLLGTGIFAIALFLFELLGMFGVALGGALNIHHYPVVGIMLSLQLLVLAAALSWRQILVGLYDAITFTPSPNSIPSVAVLMTVIYDIIMALIAPNTGLNLYNFPAALCLVFLVLNDYFNLSREIRAFNTIATRRPKYAVSLVKNDGEHNAEQEMMEIFGGEEQTGSAEKVLETRRVGFIENYFRRTNIRSIKDRKLCLVIFPFIALAIALGVVSFVANRSGVTAFNVSILTVLFGMPMSSLFIYSFPFFSAVNTAFEKDATIIGEESIDEYSDASTVVFSDKEVFPVEATVTRGIKLYDNNAIYYVLYHLTSLYSKIGGPLKERLEQATTEMGHSDDVQITRVERKGVEAIVDGKVHVLAGQASFMAENGIAIGYDADDDAMYAEGATALYLVLDGVLSAKLYVSYNIDPEFENVISILESEHMETVIRTCDPNIDDELLAAKLRVSRFPARIVKCTAEENEDADSAESGIVSRSSLTALARTITLCNKIRRVRKTSKTVSILSMVVSVIMMIFLSLFSSKLGVPSLYVALYQVFWLIPMALFTKLYVK